MRRKEGGRGREGRREGGEVKDEGEGRISVGQAKERNEGRRAKVRGRRKA